jgi:hypothetical protein
MTTLPKMPARVFQTEQQLAEKARQAEGTANLARDALYLQRQDAATAHARAVLAAYPERQAEIDQARRQAGQRFGQAVADGQWPGAAWLEMRAAWHRSYHLTVAAANACRTLQDTGETVERLVADPTWRDPSFTADLAAALEAQAVEQASDTAAALDAEREQALGDTFAPTRPGRWEEWTTTRTDGAIMRVEKNHDTGEMHYTVLVEPPEPVVEDEAV